MTKEEIIDVIHKTMYQFFDVCGDNEEVPMSDKDELLLSVNKAICNNIKALCESSSENPNKWIPCSERLPEEGKEVLVYYEYFRYGDYNCMQSTYGVGYQYNGNWCGDVRGHKLNVIAWHPLPRLHKAESEDKK